MPDKREVFGRVTILDDAGDPYPATIPVDTGLTEFPLPAAQVAALTPPAAITGFATSVKQSDGSQKTQIIDSSGNVQPAGDSAARAVKVDASATTQPISAASLPLPAGASTEATLLAVKNAILAQLDLATSLWTDDSDAFYVRRDVINQQSGVVTVTFTDATGAPATPGAGLRPVADDYETEQSLFDATSGGTGYSSGDVLGRVLIIDTSASPVSVTAVWTNLTTGASIGTPTGGTYVEVTKNVTVAVSALPSNAAQETGGNLAAIKAKTDNIPALGEAVAAGSVPVVLASDHGLLPLLPSTVGVTPDSSGYARDGTLEGTPSPILIPDPSGLFGNAIQFNGVDNANSALVQGILVPNVPTALTQWGMRARFRYNGGTGAYGTIGGRADGASIAAENLIALLDPTDHLYVEQVNAAQNGTASITGPTALVAGNDYEVEFGWDGTTLRALLSLAGALATLEGSAAAGTLNQTPTAPFRIGKRNGAANALPAKITLKEFEFSTKPRHTAAYTPTTTPWARDEYTAILYRCDVIGSGINIGQREMKDSVSFAPASDADMARASQLPDALRNSRLDAADTYTAGEVLADQAGADAVLTFTFANPMDLIWVESTGADSRCDPFGGTPTVGLGVPCRDGIPKPLVIRATVVKVYAPTGASVNVFGQRYS